MGLVTRLASCFHSTVSLPESESCESRFVAVSGLMAHSVKVADPVVAPAFQPYVPATQSPAEFTVKAVILGVLFGLIFGASTVISACARG